MWAKIKTLPILSCKLVHGWWSEEFKQCYERKNQLFQHWVVEHLKILVWIQEHLNPSTLVQDVCLGWIGWMERHSSLSRSQSRLVVASRCNADDSLYAAFQTRFYNRAFLPGCTIAKHIEPSARIINPGRQPRNINVETKSLLGESVVILILIYQRQREMWKLKIEKNTGYLWGC